MSETNDSGESGGWFSRLKRGLSKTSEKLTTGIKQLFTHKKLDDETLDGLEELLIGADLGPSAAAQAVAALRKSRFGSDITEEEIRAFLADHIAAVLKPYAARFQIGSHTPHVILVVGVNGVGKTTTIGKLAKSFADEGKRVVMGAGDTFRAAAVEQLQIWGRRTGTPVVAKEQGADSAAVAYEAIMLAKEQGADVVLIDTAGRLHTKSNLMDELKKIVRVIQKADPSAPHDVVLVLDGTTGQNAHSQLDVFRTMAPLTGLVVTKLDGTAKGGVVVALAEKFKLPIYAIGVGETAEDLRPFAAEDFARFLVGAGSLK